MMSKSKVPQIRFKEFSGEWNNENLRKLANFSKGQGYSKNDLIEDGKPIILYGRLYTKYQAVISKVDTYVKEQQNSILSKGNEVVVPASGETAEDIARASAIKTPNLLIGGDLNIIYPNNEIDNLFLALNISNGKTQKNLSKKAQGKSVVHLRNNDLKEIDLFYPYKDEQIKISNYFQQLDILIEQKENKYQKLKQFKKAMLDKMFPKNGADTPEIRFKGFSGKWEEKTLGDIGQFKSGTGFSEKEQGGKIGVPFFKVSDMNLSNNKSFMNEANNYVSQEQIERMQYKPINELSIIFAKVGAAIFLERKRMAKNFLLDNNMMSFIPNDIDIFFLFHWINKIKLSTFTQIGALPSYNANDLKIISISLPTIEEQQKIGNYFQKLDIQIDLQQKELEKLKNIKKASLAKMFV